MRPFLYACTATALSLVSICLVACASPGQSQIDQSSSEDDTVNLKVSEKFASNFFKLAAASPETNVVISPYSVSTALSMVYNGAVGKTKTQMQEVLGYAGITDDAVNEQNASLYKSLMHVNPVSELTVANALFANKDFAFEKSFTNTNQKYFGAKLETLDFADATTLDKINNWVKDNTKGKIPTIIDQVPQAAILYLVNAVYFKGMWLDEFVKDQTQAAEFTVAGGAKKQIQIMNRSDKMHYLKGKNFQAVMLPYKDKRLQMCVFLPDQKSDINALVASFTEENLKNWSEQFGKKEGHLGLPRFKVEYKTELSKVLKEAGMPCAFEDSCADFKNMTKEPSVISRVLHKTYLEVNEKGTEAAAATAVEMSVTSAPAEPEPPFEMVCDRPFVVAIRDSKTNAILFLGAIVDPPPAD